MKHLLLVQVFLNLFPILWLNFPLVYIHSVLVIMPCLRQSFSDLSLCSPGLNLMPLRVGFVVDKVALGRFFSECLSFPYQYHSTHSPYSFVHLSLTLYDQQLAAFLNNTCKRMPWCLHDLRHGWCWVVCLLGVWVHILFCARMFMKVMILTGCDAMLHHILCYLSHYVA